MKFALLNRVHSANAIEQLLAAVREKRGVNSFGKNLHYYLNYSADRQTFNYVHGSGTDLLTGKTISSTQPVSIEPWDVAIIEEP